MAKKTNQRNMQLGDAPISDVKGWQRRVSIASEKASRAVRDALNTGDRVPLGDPRLESGRWIEVEIEGAVRRARVSWKWPDGSAMVRVNEGFDGLYRVHGSAMAVVSEGDQ